MAAAQPETKAQQYKRIKAERLAKETLHDFEAPSGLVWTLRRPNLAQFVMSGVMPMSLAGKLAKADEQANGDHKTAFSSLDWKDQAKTIEFSAKVVRYSAVDPKIVDNPTEPNEIAPDDVELDDFNAIFAWAMPGGDGAATLDTFPTE